MIFNVGFEFGCNFLLLLFDVVDDDDDINLWFEFVVVYMRDVELFYWCNCFDGRY